MSNKIPKADFSERMFETGVICKYFSILPEEFTLYMPSTYEEGRKGKEGYGYDARVISLYMQFKRPFYFSIVRDRRRKIIDDRIKLGIKHWDEYVYFFNVKEKQHNALFDLSQDNNPVFYVAPMFHCRRFFNYWIRTLAFSQNKYYVLISSSGRNFETLRSFPYLRDVIYIKPHLQINNDNHKYSYDISYKVVFHSKPGIVEKKYIYNGLEFLNLFYSFDVKEYVKSLEDVIEEQKKILDKNIEIFDSAYISFILKEFLLEFYDADERFSKLLEKKEIKYKEIDKLLEDNSALRLELSTYLLIKFFDIIPVYLLTLEE
ncbi:hypothetical protein [Desulfurobacterium sp.]